MGDLTTLKSFTILKISSSVSRRFPLSPCKDLLYRTMSSDPKIWLKSPKDLTEEDYHEFYHRVFNDPIKPLAYTHYSDSIRKGETEYASMLFIASPTLKNVCNQKIFLYSKAQYISDASFNKFPSFLPFVKGIVDVGSLDPLPEGEMEIINKRLVSKTVRLLSGIAVDSEMFWKNFGQFMLNACNDPDYCHEFASLLRFVSSRSKNQLISLEQYVEMMRPDQNTIYYHLPLVYSDSLDSFPRKKGEVLILESLSCPLKLIASYKGKTFADIEDEDGFFMRFFRWIWKLLSEFIADCSKSFAKESASYLAFLFGTVALRDVWLPKLFPGLYAKLKKKTEGTVKKTEGTVVMKFDASQSNQLLKLHCFLHRDDEDALKAVTIALEGTISDDGIVEK